MKLYELSNNYKLLREWQEDEAINGNFSEQLSRIKSEIEDTVENIAKYILELKATEKALKDEEQRIKSRRETIHNNYEWLKNYIMTEMATAGIKKVSKDLFSVWIADNPPSIEIENEELIPEQFIRIIPEIREPNKKAILEHFKGTGEIVEGTRVNQDKRHLEIR